jgi:hypothetical protein
LLLFLFLLFFLLTLEAEEGIYVNVILLLFPSLNNSIITLLP